MKVIRSINNNVAICVDSNGNELVAFGKGIGFQKGPHEIKLNKVERTYYNLNDQYITMINDIPEEIIQISDLIIMYAQSKLKHSLNPNTIITLADHINFSFKRYAENIGITLPIIQDIQYFYRDEMNIGEYAVNLINKKMNANLPMEESAFIALHIINAENMMKSMDMQNERIIKKVLEIIEDHFKIHINKSDFNYSRFLSHMNYLLKRVNNQNLSIAKNFKLYDSLVKNYQETYECTKKISNYLSKIYDIHLNDEEISYLIIHINRLCIREDCYR